ncbi:MAG: galactokinase family protein, partial [Bacillota bacterium]
MKKEITKKHQEIFKEAPSSVHFMPGILPLAGEHIEEAGGQALLLPVNHGITLAISETKGSGITIYDTLLETKKTYPLMEHTLKETLPREEKTIHALFNKLHKERGTTEKSYNITIMPSLDNYHAFHLEQAKLLLIAYTLNRYLSWNIMHEKLIKYTNDVYLT